MIIETKYLLALKNYEGFPNVYFYHEGKSHNYMVLDLLGDSLENYINKYKKLSLKTTVLLGMQMVKINTIQ